MTDPTQTAKMTLPKAIEILCECERLQGMPDDYSLIPYYPTTRRKLEEDYIKYLMRGGKLTREECFKLAADGPRYKAIGNSMAVPVMAWIFNRIDQLNGVMSYAR